MRPMENWMRPCIHRIWHVRTRRNWIQPHRCRIGRFIAGLDQKVCLFVEGGSPAARGAERESERSRAERRGIECGAVAVTGAVERIARSAG
jgi:hypothetical protein